MENLYSKNLSEITEKDFKFGFALQSVTIDYPRLGLPIVKITYITNNTELNLVENGINSEICFEVSMDKQEILTILVAMANSSIVETIKYLLERQPDLLNAKYIMEKMPTSLYSNVPVAKDIMNSLPRNARIQEVIKPVIDKKKSLLDNFKEEQKKKLEEQKKAEDSFNSLISDFTETFDE